ncbi:MAG: hypothetical protein WCS34_08765 [Bacteroidales bacterium]
MKNIFLTSIAVLLLSATTQSAFAQHKFKIGDKEISLNPFEVTDLAKEESHFESGNFVPYHFDESYVGFGLATSASFNGDDYLGVDNGNSYNFTIGRRDFYRFSKAMAIGIQYQYSSLSYRLSNAAADGLLVGAPAPLPIEQNSIRKEVFRTDNLGLGLVLRLIPTENTFIDLSAYGDYAYSKRYKVKYYSVYHHKKKKKFRDGDRFEPFAFGTQITVGYDDWAVFAKYRFSDMFTDTITSNEPPRMHIGIQFLF